MDGGLKGKRYCNYFINQRLRRIVESDEYGREAFMDQKVSLSTQLERTSSHTYTQTVSLSLVDLLDHIKFAFEAGVTLRRLSYGLDSVIQLTSFFLLSFNVFFICLSSAE